MRGKWAEGIEPRDLCWVVPDVWAVCERIGGCGASHRKVRRHEEIVWLRRSPFDLVVSLLSEPYNLHNYAELQMPYRHFPWPQADDELPSYLAAVHAQITELTQSGSVILLHKDHVGEDLRGFVAASLLLSGTVRTGPQAAAVVERLLRRRLGPRARAIIGTALDRRSGASAHGA